MVNTPRYFRRSVVLAAGGVLGALAGCASEGARSSGFLTAGDFRAADAAEAPDRAATGDRTPALRMEAVAVERQDVAVLSGPPTLEPTPAPAVGARATDASPVMMDSLIGDINGTPVYATTFFTEAIEARLAGVAAKDRGNEQAWASEAREIIGGVGYDQQKHPRLFGQLGNLIRDELLLSEARASLSPEQKQGLLSFIEQVRRDLVSRGGGAEAAVDESLREQGENGLDDAIKKNIDRQLVQLNLRERILPRATVSWHDVEVEYERRAEKFNPDPKAVFRMIWILASKSEVVEQ